MGRLTMRGARTDGRMRVPSGRQLLSSKSAHPRGAGRRAARCAGAAFKFLLAGVIALLALPVHLSKGEPEPALSFAVPYEEPLSLHLVPSDGDSRVGRLNVMLRNNSSYKGPLTIELLTSSADKPLPLSTTKPSFEEDKLTFFTNEANGYTATPFGVTPVPLLFGTTKTTKLTSVDGMLVFRGDGSTPLQPAMLRIKVVVEEGPLPWSAISFEPEKVTINATRWVPFAPWWSNGMTNVWLRGDDTNKVKQTIDQALGDALPTTRLSSGNGGTLRLTLDKNVEIVEGGKRVRAKVKVADASQPGIYEGTLSLDPADKNAGKIAVTVSAQDFFFWPFVALAIGAWGGWALSNGYERHRVRQRLRGSLKAAARSYDSEGPRATKIDCPYNLDNMFGTQNRLFPTKRECANLTPITPEVTKLYCDIHMVTSQEDLDRISAKVTDMVKQVALWPEVCKATKELREKRQDLQKVDDYKQAAVYATTIGLLERATKVPEDAPRAESLLKQMREQAIAIDLFVAGKEIVRGIRPMYTALLVYSEELKKDNQWETLIENDPEVLDQQLMAAGTVQDINRAGVIDALQRARDALLSLMNSYAKKQAGREGDRRQSKEDLTTLLDTADYAQEGATIRSKVMGLKEAGQRVGDVRTPEQIVAALRVTDWLVAVIAAVVVMAVFFLSIYVGKNFGTVEDYIGALLAGLSGQLLINWALFPWFRSYQLGPPAENTR